MTRDIESGTEVTPDNTVTPDQETAPGVTGTITTTAPTATPTPTPDNSDFFSMLDQITQVSTTTPTEEVTRQEDIVLEQQLTNERAAHPDEIVDDETAPAVDPTVTPVPTPEPQPRTPTVNMSEVQQSLAELGRNHATTDLRTNIEERQRLLDQRLEELRTQHNLTDDQVTALRQSYSTEFDRISQARAQAIAQAETRLTQTAQSHVNGQVASDQRTTNVDQVIENINRQTPLTQQEEAALRSHYASQYQTLNQERSERIQGQVTSAQQELDQLARQQAANPNRDEIVRQMREIIARHNEGLTSTETTALGTYLEGRLQHHRNQHLDGRREALQDALRRNAEARARYDLGVDGASEPRSVESIMRQYSDVAGSMDQRELTRAYERAYERQRDYSYDNELSWWGRRKADLSSAWNSITSAISAGIQWCREQSPAFDNLCNLGEAIGELAVEAGEALVAAGEWVVDTAIAAGEWVVETAVAVGEWVADPQNWIDLGNTLYNGAVSVYNAVKDGVVAAAKWAADPENWKNLGNTLLSAGQAVWNAVSDPANWLAAAKAAWGAIKATGTFLGKLATFDGEAWGQVWEGVKAVGGFLKDMSDAIGLTDLAVGVWNIAVVAPFQQLRAIGETLYAGAMILSGNMTVDEFKAQMKESWGRVAEAYGEGLRAVKGAVLALGEITGVTDVVMCVKYALEGNWAMAGMHAGFALLSIGSLAATVATAGAAGGSMAAVMAGRMTLKQAGKTVLQTACKEFLETAGKEMGEQVLKNLTKEVGSEVLEQTLKQTAEEGAERVAKEIAQEVLEQGPKALTEESMERLGKKIGAEQTEKVLRELGVDKLVTKQVDELLQVAGKPKELLERIKQLGFDDKAAKEMSSQFRKALKSGKSDEAIKEALTQSMSKPIREYVEAQSEQAFKGRLRTLLRGAADGSDEALEALGREGSEALGKAVRENAERLGKTVDEYVDELTEAAWKGYKEGIREAVEKVVREGIDEAFRKYRARPRLSLGSGNITVQVLKQTLRDMDLPPGTPERLAEKVAEKRPAEAPINDKVISHVITAPDGTQVLVTERFNAEKQIWETLSAQVVGEKKNDDDGGAMEVVDIPDPEKPSDND